MALTDYLKLRGHTYYVQVSIPAPLRKAAGGKSEYIKSLKTGDLGEANRRKHPYVAAFKQRIVALGRNKPNEQSELYEKPLAWREAMERHKGEVCQSALDRDPVSASKRDPLVLRFERLAFAPSELAGVAETGRARVGV